MKRMYAKIGGIHCDHCVHLISSELLKNKKIQNVSIEKDIAYIEYTGTLSKKEIVDAICSIDYITNEEMISDNLDVLDSSIKLKEFFLILGVILGLWLFINKIFGFNIFNVIPTIDSSITFGMLFVTGLLTSIHCISMCGAINLMAVVNTRQNLKKPLLYNLGRVFSYTLIGGICGAVGHILSIHNIVLSIVILLASIFMLLLSLSMLGIFSFRFSFLRKWKIKHKTRNFFLIGLLNGFMPCGPLQAMQVYALSTGSFALGSLSMFLFCLGTVPLMLIIGVVFNTFKGKRKILLNKVASILILILSFIMLNRGLLSLDIDFSKAFKNYGNFTATTFVEDYQVIEFDLDYNHYKDILVQKDVPVRLVIHVDKKYLTGCNNEVVFRNFGVRKKLEEGDNIIEFTPRQEGVFTYTCWMEMIQNYIKVIDDKDYFKEEK